MAQAFKIFVRVDARRDNLAPSMVQDIVRSRHKNFIVEPMYDGFWRGFREETFVVQVHDIEEAVLETAELIKQELQEEYVQVLALGDTMDV